MKKTAIALMMGLFAIGCGGNPPAKQTNTPAPAMTPEQVAKMTAATAASTKEAEKAADAPAADGDKPAVEGDKPAAEGEKPAAEEKKEEAPAEPK